MSNEVLKEYSLKTIKEEIEQYANLAQMDIVELTRENGIADTVIKGVRELKITQLRRFFDSIKSIEAMIDDTSDWDRKVHVRFAMLRPYLANARGRNLIEPEFYDFIKTCMDKVICQPENGKIDVKQTLDNFELFVQIMESLVAYYRYYNPKGGN